MSLAKINQLVEWATQNGAVISPNIKFDQISPDNIGAVYEKSTEDGKETQIKVPISIILTLKEAIKGLNEATGASASDFDEISTKTSNINSTLKLYLAKERTTSSISKSFYKPYLELLPTSEQINSPYTWNSADKALLKGTNLGESLKQNLAQLVEEWWQIINLLPESLAKPQEHFVNMKFYYEHKFYTDDDFYRYFITDEDTENWTSFPNYLWASLILKSRSFPSYLLKESTGLEYKQDEAMLLPVVDLLNHNSQARVKWGVQDGFFEFRAESDGSLGSGQLYNNYGMKGNEELLLAYGFCLETNPADSAALKIKLPQEIIDQLKANDVQLPTISDYTTSVVRSAENKGEEQNYDDGVVFFITASNLPETLVQVFQYLVRTSWEQSGISLRMQLAGINQLRNAIDAKNSLIGSLPNSESVNSKAIQTYIQSQKSIFSATIKKLKHLEKSLLSDSKYKPRFITLKNVYKKDLKFQQSLLVSLGATSYDSILDNQLQDQCWLLWLIRCYNRDEYLTGEIDEDGDEENYLPLWVQENFKKLDNIDIAAAEILQYRTLYQGLIEPLSKAVPEIYNKGQWGVRQLITSAKLLDNISFTRGKDQECILVQPEQ